MILLPPGVIQPFFLRYRRDDLHVMAVFEGHPAYEAVEAMVSPRADASWAVRAILTRHDGSQVDHINDETLLAAMQGASREVSQCAIDFSLGTAGSRPHARLAFTSAAGEAILLDLTAAGPADPRGAGLSDPGAHSATSSLPLMWRGKSALAGAETFVTVDGRRYAPPIRFREPFVAAEGYYTEGHAMGVIRAGTLVSAAVREPAGVLEYGVLRIEHDGQTVLARPRGERLELVSVSVPADGDPSRRLVLAFDGAGGFGLSMEGQTDLVAGRASSEDGANGTILTLAPTAPGWAAARPVRVMCERSGDQVVCTTTIGDAAATRV